VEAIDPGGQSALDWACRTGGTETIADLIIAGADVNHTDRFGMSPVHWAAQTGNEIAMKCLYLAGK
jgi:ankyrin repeat protein